MRDGESALLAAASEAYEVLLLDLGLPNADGRDVLRQLRANGCKCPVIIVTARDITQEELPPLQDLHAGIHLLPYAYWRTGLEGSYAPAAILRLCGEWRVLRMSGAKYRAPLIGKRATHVIGTGMSRRPCRAGRAGSAAPGRGAA